MVTTQTAAENPKFETVSGTLTIVSDPPIPGESWLDRAGNLHRHGWYFSFDVISSDVRLDDGATAVDEFNMNAFAHRPGDVQNMGKVVA